MSIGIASIAWIKNDRVYAKGVGAAAMLGVKDMRAPNPSIVLFPRPVENFGRFPEYAKLACETAALALKAGGIDRATGNKLDVAMLCAGYENTTDADCNFFQDYLDCGRELGRGALFVYTLPTSALADVSIALGLTGAALYLESDITPFAELYLTARGMIENGETKSALLLWQNRQTSLCALVDDRAESEHYIRGKEAGRIVERWNDLKDAVAYLHKTRFSGGFKTR